MSGEEGPLLTSFRVPKVSRAWGECGLEVGGGKWLDLGSEDA